MRRGGICDFDNKYSVEEGSLGLQAEKQAPASQEVKENDREEPNEAQKKNEEEPTD